jgi:hypothetical protein
MSAWPTFLKRTKARFLTEHTQNWQHRSFVSVGGFLLTIQLKLFRTAVKQIWIIFHIIKPSPPIHQSIRSPFTPSVFVNSFTDIAAIHHSLCATHSLILSVQFLSKEFLLSVRQPFSLSIPQHSLWEHKFPNKVSVWVRGSSGRFWAIGRSFVTDVSGQRICFTFSVPETPRRQSSWIRRTNRNYISLCINL